MSVEVSRHKIIVTIQSLFAKMGSLMQALLTHFMQICLALNGYR